MLHEIGLKNGGVAKCWQTDEQEYSNARFSAGHVLNMPPEDVYLRLEREGEEATTIFLRKDEAQSLAWLLNGALWSLDMVERAENVEDIGDMKEVVDDFYRGENLE